MMKARLLQSLTSALIFITVTLFSLGSASALPYSENNHIPWDSGMTLAGYTAPESLFPARGAFLFTDSGSEMLLSTIMEDFPLRRPTFWDGMPFGNMEAAYRNFIPNAFLHLGWINDSAWSPLDRQSHDFPTPVPESATLFLLGSGLIGLVGVYRKQSKR
jgi:hypothetical protein